MASTIFNQARVWSRMTASGDVVYLWEENTHCIKDGPKQASWCFMKFGRKAEIIERIYRCAESIPGGMLKCGTSPERFIENMLKLLDNPLEMTARRVRLENSKSGFYAAIDDDNRQAVVQKLSQMGRLELASKIDKSPQDGGESGIDLDLVTDSDVLMELANNTSYKDGTWGTARGITPWRIFRHAAGHDGRNGPSEQTPNVSKVAAPEIRVFRVPVDLRYKGATAPEYPNVLTVDRRVVCVALSLYEMHVAMVQAACEFHLKTGVCIVRKMMSALKESMTSITDLAPDGVFRLVLVDRSNAYATREFGAAGAYFGHPGGDSLVVSFDAYSRFAADKGYDARTLITGSDAVVVSFDLDDQLEVEAQEALF